MSQAATPSDGQPGAHLESGPDPAAREASRGRGTATPTWLTVRCGRCGASSSDPDLAAGWSFFAVHPELCGPLTGDDAA